MEQMPQEQKKPMSYEEAIDTLRKGCKIELNWEAYYDAFSTKHGGKPVLHLGRSLWHDGWTYSATSFEGMEYPPPQDPLELMNLKKAYWDIRISVVKQDLYYLEEQLEKLKLTQDVRSAPLQYNFVVVADDGTQKVETGELNLNHFKIKIMELKVEIDECERNLNVIEPELRRLQDERRQRQQWTDNSVQSGGIVPTPQ